MGWGKFIRSSINGSKGGDEMKLLLLIIYILVACILFILGGFFEEELSKGVRDKETVIIGIFIWPIPLVLLLGWAILALPPYIFNKIGIKLRKKYEKFSKNN